MAETGFHPSIMLRRVVMISIGQLMGRALGALWRRRGPVLGIVILWLLLDSLLLSYLKIFRADFGLAYLLWFRGTVTEAFATSFWFGALISFIPEMLRDAIRAICAVLLLRTILTPEASAGARPPIGLLRPIWLVFLFELAWTAILHPPSLGVLQLASLGVMDIRTNSYLMAYVDSALFLAYALVMARICFVLPSASLGLGLRARKSWTQTRGLAMRVFLFLVAIPIPLFVAAIIAKVLIFRFGYSPETVHYQVMGSEVADSAAFVVGGVLTLAVIAVAYVAATGYRAAAIPGANRTPEQLAEAFD